MRRIVYRCLIVLCTAGLLLTLQPVNTYSAGSEAIHPTSISDPVTLGTSASYTGGPFPAGVDLWFSFIPEQTGSYEITMQAEGGLYGALIDSSRSSVIMANETAEGSDRMKLASTCLAGEQYFIRISSAQPGASVNLLTIAIEALPLPNDEFFTEQWSLYNPLNGIDINIIPVWKDYKGSAVPIGVADTGADIEQPDLINRLDMSLAYNFTHNMKDVFPQNEKPSGSSARAGHGTHVTGIIVAESNNGQGIAGILPQGSAVPLKVMGSRLTDSSVYNGSIAAFVQAVEYAKSNHIRIINCSFGGASPAITEKEAMYQANDILFVIAAGNSGSNLAEYPEYPASYYHDNSLVVAAQNSEGELAGFSNYGGPTDIAAPGEAIISTFPNSLYLYSSGTSMAASVVSAVSGLVWGKSPELTAQQVKQIVTAADHVTSIRSLSGKVLSGGMVNAYKAVMSVPSGTGPDNERGTKLNSIGRNPKSSIEAYMRSADRNSKTNQIIVKFKEGVPAKKYIDEVDSKYPLSEIKLIDYLDSVDAYVLQLPTIEEADTAITMLNKSDSIVYAEPNYLRESN